MQYTAVSIFPFICFNYVSRWIVYSAGTNRSFLQYPIIKPLDLLIGRALLETVSISMVAMMLITTVAAIGDNAMPASPTQAAYAFGATLFLAIGMGIFNGAIALVVPFWQLVYILVIVLSYISSGAIFVVSNMPEAIRVPLSYVPLLHCTEWMRSAYYPDYPTQVLDRLYLLKVSLCLLTGGFALTRLLRRFM